MYLLGPFYQWLVRLFDGRVNHLPLVRLFIFSVDHAIILFLGWLIVWSIYLFSRKKGEIVWKWELYRNLFIFYIILLAQLTIFRSTYAAWIFLRFALWKRERTLPFALVRVLDLFCHRVLSIYLLHRSQPYRRHSL